MKILTPEQIRTCDTYTIAHEPITSIDLMERASTKLLEWILDHYNPSESFVLFAGTGNNGGDTIALTRLLFNKGYKNLQIVWLKYASNISADCQTNYERLRLLDGVRKYIISPGDQLPTINKHDIIIDGIFGSGLTRDVQNHWANAIEYINLQASEILSIDIPSGLFCENNSNNNGAIIKANYTLSFQFPKLAFMLPENEEYVGHWEALDIALHPEIISNTESQYKLIEHAYISNKIKSRKKFAHKGTFGHAFLIAGSYQKTGAAILAARACMRSGVGLLTVHVPKSAYNIMQSTVPEAMLCIDETETNYCTLENLAKYAAIGIGPGIGKKQSITNALHQVLKTASSPIVFDADALNILSEHPDWLDIIPENSILTPHPKEFDRLTSSHTNSYKRLTSLKEFSKKHKVIVVLKGAYTAIASPTGKINFNPTGNQGMATAGSGDVLTGIILSLLAQNYSPLLAASIGVYIHGLSGDFAYTKTGFESLIASDIIDHLYLAFKDLKRQ